ncbi:MAG: ATP-dependent Clp protease proteolytic subunit [Prochlorococcaceae cyanobacterium]
MRPRAIRALLVLERILFMGSEVNEGVANALVAQMLYLDSEDSSKLNYRYINSPGGSVTAGLAIYDTMQCVKSDVVTICVGLATAIGAFLLGAGTSQRQAHPDRGYFPSATEAKDYGLIDRVIAHPGEA